MRFFARWALAALLAAGGCGGPDESCESVDCPDGAVGDAGPLADADLDYDAGPATDPPRAVFTVDPPRVAQADGHETVVTLDGRGSEGGGLRFAWSVPDGTFVDGTGPNDPVARVTVPGTVDHDVMLEVTNALGDDVALGRVRVNRPPVAHVTGGGIVAAAEPLTLDGSGSSDPDGDSLSYRWTLTRAPEASSASVSGSDATLAFTPDVGGAYVIALVVDDGLDSSPPFEVPLFATTPDVGPPTVSVSATPRVVATGSPSRICVDASGPAGIASVRALVDGVNLPLGGDGCADATASEIARYRVTGIAIDSFGTEVRAFTDFFGRAASDDGPPTVSLTSPEGGSLIERAEDVLGTADDSDLVAYRVEARRVGSSADFVPFIEGDTPVVGDRLGEVTPGRFRPGPHEVRLCALDSYANESCTTPIHWSFAGGDEPGFLRLRFRDAQLDDIGLPIVVFRTYDSRDLTSSDFGHGWHLELEGFGELDGPADPGADWQETGCLGLPFSPTYTPLGPKVFEVHAGSRRHRFEMRLIGQACGPTGGSQANVAFAPLPGTSGTFTALGADDTNAFFNRGEGRLYNGDLITPWQPTGYRLELPDGTRFDMSRTEVTSIRSPSGAVVSFDGSRLTSDAGVIDLDRDTLGRITSLRVGDRERTYAYDGRGDLVRTVDPGGVETRFTYDYGHRLTGIVDPRGGVPGTMEYDEAGRVVAIVDSSGRRIAIARDPDARQEVITDRLGHTYVFFYDDAGRLIRRVDAEGHERRWTWSDEGWLVSQVDENGDETRFEYDTAGNRTATIDAEGNRWEATFDAAGRETSSTDPLGNTRRTEYGPDGEVSALVDAAGERTTLTYSNGALGSVSLPEGSVLTLARNADGQLTSTTDALGRTVNIDHDARGNPTRTSSTLSIGGAATEVAFDYEHDATDQIRAVTGPDGSHSSVTHDERGLPVQTVTADGSGQALEHAIDGRVTSVVGPTGERFGIDYDAESRPVGLTLPSGAVIRTERDANGRVNRQRFPGGVEVAYERDPAGRVVGVTDAMGRRAGYRYDRAGRVTEIERPDGTTTTYGRDAAGRLVSIADPARGTTTVSYDPEGRPTTLSIAGGGSASLTYDEAGRASRIESPEGRRLDYGYDAVGQLITARDRAGNTATYTYDGAGNLEAIETPEGVSFTLGRDVAGRLISRGGGPFDAAETITYDDAGRTATTTDPTGVRVDYDHDPTGRLVARSGPSLTETRTYDESGRLRTVDAATGTTSLTYDAAGHLARVTSEGGRFLELTHDPSGLPLSLRGRGGEARYEWNAEGRLVAVIDPSGGRTEYGYDSAGRVSERRLPNGVTTTYSYDSAGRLTRVNHGGLLDERYQRDTAGRITRVDRGGASVEYSYDGEGRLAEERRGGSATAFDFDADGNLRARGGTNLSYDARGRLTSFGGEPLTWDAAGRMQSRVVDGVTETYAYDDFGRLSRIERAGGSPATIELAYGGDDLLERVSVDGEVRHLVWDRTGALPLLVEEVADGGAVLARYTWGPGGPIAVTRSDGTRYLHSDARRSIRLETNAAGDATTSADYDALGLPIGDAPGGLGFAGEWQIPGTDLVYLRARVLEPRSARFLTPDPASADLDEPLSLNPYLYGLGDPVNRFDPTGRFSLGSLNAAMNIMGVLATIALSLWDSPESLVADAIGIRDIVGGDSTWRGVTAQVGAEGLLGGGRGNAGTWTRMVGVSAFLGVDAYFSPPTIALWVSFGAYIQVGGAGRGLRSSMKGGFLIGPEGPPSAGLEAGASGARVVLWVSSRYILGRLRPRGARFAQVIRFVQQHVHGIELSLKPGLELAVRAKLGRAQTTQRWRSFRIGFELKWVFFAFDGEGLVGTYPWQWSEQEWQDLFRRFSSPF